MAEARGEGGQGPEEFAEPTLDDFLDSLDEDIGRGRPCPICGGDKWASVPVPVAFLSFQTTRDGGAVGLEMAMLFCMKCLFVRLHVLTPISESLPSRRDKL
jgi:hypothetical protein